MGFSLKCHLSESWNDWSLDWGSTAGEVELRYSKLLGDIIISDGINHFNASWGWIPLLDFVLCLSSIYKNLKEGCEYKVFEFTESDEKLIFQKIEDCIEINATFSEGIVLVDIDVLEIAITKYSKDLRLKSSILQPGLLKNNYFNSVMDDLILC